MEFNSMQSSLQDALDDLASSRSSMSCKSRALSALEHILAIACVPNDSSGDLEMFVVLQDAFNCNVPSRLLGWIAQSTPRLEYLTNRGPVDHERHNEVTTLSSQLCQSLSIIQGVVLNHQKSKQFLGRRYSLEILLDLLLVSRHIASRPLVPATNFSIPRFPTPPPPLSSVVLDTLLCILVDCSAALRAFEKSNGVQAVVKILKRAGTPREVRMKCLEFLYFYLLDETSPSTSPTFSPSPCDPQPQSPSDTDYQPPTEPTTPTRTNPKASTNSKPLPFGTKPIPSIYSAATLSLNSPSRSSISSFSSTSSNAPSSRRSVSGSSMESDETARTSPRSNSPPRTPPDSPQSKPQALASQTPLISRPLMMLRKELNFVPISPKKSSSGHVRAKSTPLAKFPTTPIPKAGTRDISPTYTPVSKVLARFGSESESWAHLEDIGWTREGSGSSTTADGEKLVRTTEEKKDILGNMLGNVDALVEGVRKAGIWGLG